MIIEGTTNTIDRNQRGPLPLKRVKDIEPEKKRLLKASKEMESLFLYQLLKTMRQTIPQDDNDETKGIGGGLGKDMYTQLFDHEIAMKMAGSSDRSIASMLYRSLVNRLDNQDGVESNAKSEVDKLFPVTRFMKINPPESITTNQINKENSRFDYIIERAAAKHRLAPLLVKAVIKAESNFNPSAVSSAGAKGLMQLLDSTASDMGVKDVYSPKENIFGGSKYLREMIDRFGNIEKALAAYNAGPKAVERYEGIPPYPETIQYVKTVLHFAGNGEHFFK